MSCGSIFFRLDVSPERVVTASVAARLTPSSGWVVDIVFQLGMHTAPASFICARQRTPTLQWLGPYRPGNYRISFV